MEKAGDIYTASDEKLEKAGDIYTASDEKLGKAGDIYTVSDTKLEKAGDIYTVSDKKLEKAGDILQVGEGWGHTASWRRLGTYILQAMKSWGRLGELQAMKPRKDTASDYHSPSASNKSWGSVATNYHGIDSDSLHCLVIIIHECKSSTE